MNSCARLLAVLTLLLGAQVQHVSAQACGKGPNPPPPPEPTLRIGAGVKVLALIDAGLPVDLGLTYFFDNTTELRLGERDLGLVPLAVTPYPPGGSRTSFSVVQANADVCPFVHDLAPGALAGCAGVYGGLLTAKPEGFIDEANATRAAFGLEVYARWRYTLGGPIGLTYSAGLFVPLLRPSFGYVDGNGVFREQFRVAPLGGRLDVALTYGF